MDLKNLSTFIQVAELRSFTRAADKLGYSQSTVSTQIRQLELELGVQLFERINHTVSITDDGRRLLRVAQGIDELMAEFHHGPTGEAVEGHVRLAMADSLCCIAVRRVFPLLHRRHPGITLEIIPAGTQEMFRLLNQNQVDLVYTLDSHIYDTNYLILREQRIATHFVASPQHPLAQKKGITLKELTGESFLLTEQGMSYRRLLDEELARRSLEIRPALVSGNTDLLCSLVKQGAGISFLPDYAVEVEVQAGNIARLDVPEVEMEIWGQFLRRRDKWLSEPIRLVIEALQQFEP